MKSITSFFKDKKDKEPICILTCYDYTFARLLNESPIDVLLVGDSLGMVVQGHPSTLPVSLEEMIYHTKSVRRGAPDKFVVLDLPFLSYQVSLEEGIRSAGRAMKESGADAVKIEGATSRSLDLIRYLTEIGIPVMGHLGLTPQSFQVLGGYRVQGREPGSSEKMKQDAKRLEEAGAFALVLEMVPELLGKSITESLSIPTIGIGAGRFTNGQVLVLYDMLGLNMGFSPRFLKRFANLGEIVLEAARSYVEEVRSRTYPGKEHSFHD